MGKLYGLDGKEISSEPKVERIRPEIPMDTPEGQFIVPVVLVAQGQYQQLVNDIVQGVVDALCPNTIEGESVTIEECPTTSPPSAPPSQP